MAEIKLGPQENEPTKDHFVPVSSTLIRPWQSGKFALYIRQEGRFVLYTNKGGAYTIRHRQKLDDLGIRVLFIPRTQRKEYEHYLRDNLGEILSDTGIPVEVRTDAWYDASVSVVTSVFEEKLPRQIFRKRFSDMKKLVRDSISYFQDPKALQDVLSLVSKGHKHYNHSIGTMVLHYFVLKTYAEADDDLLIHSSLGALLHDIGKANLPPKLLEKRYDLLTGGERELYRSHPSVGVGLCLPLNLSQVTYNCILFHHEQENGKGYPSHMADEAIPLYVKTLSLCNAYDNLTRSTPHRAAFTPFEALQRLDVHKKRFHPESFRRLIMILSNADILDQPPIPLNAKEDGGGIKATAKEENKENGQEKGKGSE